MSLVHNERTKLTATYINGVAIAVFAVGSFAPAIASLNGVGSLLSAGNLIVLICLGASAALHFLARRTLKALRHDD